MNINGVEVDFDLDVRKDNARFVKAHQEIAKKLSKGGITDNDMELFLTACIKADQIKELLKDGRITTLAKVFTEFFSQAVGQFGDVSRVYGEVADTLVSMNESVSRISEEYDEVIDRIDSIRMSAGEK